MKHTVKKIKSNANTFNKNNTIRILKNNKFDKNIENKENVWN